MTALVWDKAGEKVYQTGIDRGVLFLKDGRVVVWNGLTSVEDTTEEETVTHYLDGIKYLEYISPGDFSANLKAFTYPAEFDEVNGILNFEAGLRVHDQLSQSFCLSYRTKIGDDLNGSDAGYLIHILYNILANPDASTYSTLGESGSDPTEFSWGLSAKPIRNSFFGWRPTAHFSIDSRKVSSEILQLFEDMIYGNDEINPRLPTIADILTFSSGSPEPPHPTFNVLTADFTLSIIEE